MKTAAWITGVLLVDQAAKYAVSKFFPNLIIKNPGLPFGIEGQGFFNLFIVSAGLIIFVLASRKFFLQHQIAAGLIIGGAFSNLFDRFAFGYVRDFLDIGIATMNLADGAIWIGIGMLLLSIKNPK